MDFSGIARGLIRARAYQKLAKLSVQNTLGVTKENFNVLFTSTSQPTEMSLVAMSLKEYEVLLALCDAVEGPMANKEQVHVLEGKFHLYLLELPRQKFSSAVFERAAKQAPWHVLGEKLARALLKLAFKFDAVLLEKVTETFQMFIKRLFANRDLELSDYLALLGVISGLVQSPKLLSASSEAFKIFLQLDVCIDNFDFLNDIESYISTAYSYPDLRKYLDHHSVGEFSPILFVERLSLLMSAIAESIVGSSKSSNLLDSMLAKAAAELAEDFDPLVDQLKINGSASQKGIARSITSSEEVFSLNEDSSYGPLNADQMAFLSKLSELALAKMSFLDRGESYIVYSSYNRLELGYLAKSHFLLIIGCGVYNKLIDVETATKIFHSSVSIYDVMLDRNVGAAVIQLGSLLTFLDPSVGSSLTRSFTSLVANPNFDSQSCQVASKSVGVASQVLSQDAVVTTIYALTNLLFVGNDGLQLQNRAKRNTGLRGATTADSAGLAPENGGTSNRLISRSTLKRVSSTATKESFNFSEAEYKRVCDHAVTAVSEVVAACGDESVSTLATTILSQKAIKLNPVSAPLLLKGLVSTAPYLPEKEFVILVRLIHRLTFDAYDNKKTELLEILQENSCELARILNRENPLYEVYLSELLTAIVSKGDVQVLDHHRSHNEISAIGDQISIYLKPLAALLPDVHKGEQPIQLSNNKIVDLFRNIWFNMVVHGYSINSTHGKTFAPELEKIAYNTPPLASELTWDRTETSLELNTVLKRGSSNHNVKDHRHIVGDVFEISRTLSHSRLMFLAAALFVESLRVKSGDCHTILKYYSDPSMKTSGIDRYIGPIAFHINKDFVELIHCGADKQFSADNIAEQLTHMLTLCCYGQEDLQNAAIKCCDLLINKVPSSLCHHRSLFALFDLLTLLYDSVMDAELNQYEPTFLYTASKTGIQFNLPDSYTWREATFRRLSEKARHWTSLLLAKCSYDTKSLIQAYVSDTEGLVNRHGIIYGVSFALESAGSIGPTDRELVQLSLANQASLALLPGLVSQLAWRSNFVTDLMNRVPLHTPEAAEEALRELRIQVKSLKQLIHGEDQYVPNKDVLDLMSELAGFSLIQNNNLAEAIRYLVEIPFVIFNSSIMKGALGIWGAVMKEKPQLSIIVLSEIAKRWEMSINMKQGVFSTEFDLEDPEFSKMEYSPSNYQYVSKKATAVSKTFQPHSEIIKLLSSNFEATLNQSDHLLKLFTRFVKTGLQSLNSASLHPFARYTRFELIRFGFDVLNYHIKLRSRSGQRLTELIIDGALSWFEGRAGFPFGSNVLKMKADFTLLKEVTKLLSNVNTFNNKTLELKKILLMFFLDDEISKISVWLHPALPNDTKGTFATSHLSGDHITKAYEISPRLAVNLANRYKLRNLDEILQSLISKNPLPALTCPDAVQYFIGINAGQSMPTHYLLFWDALSPIDAITLFLPPFGKNPYILQYTMRSLEHHDVNLTFFYVPQIVQSLRYDAKGYVKRFIVETARVSQLFAHQIIWNMLANSYKDEDATEPDSLKPVLDDCQQLMLESLDDEDMEFYKKEFGFFNEVTSISGKLKPYIKKSKAEKKVKIDEEMAKIDLQPDVYLPSNPDGVLVDINRKSGKPLQSHAKAPFMATFKIKKEVDDVDEHGHTIKVPIEKWQSAIFKVGDDCRQDVLALQLISVFRSIWLASGLDLYVFPYRVTATAPGCGVIDVLPNSTSRDMLGREAVNGLYQYFITKFGPETSIEFQKARNNLIRSLAAYSIISYLLQFKDRHNGNIMYDGEGHVLHIDFGFCFDIVPGGVKFEVSPFKLTKEMVMVLGGNDQTQSYKWFEELCIKGYLACRPYMETIVRCVNPMLESGLPCFKDTTIKKLRKRFAPGKSEKEAALFFKGLIKKSYESFYTTGYDEFQRLTNGIPY